jgi:hypothetical protein
VLLSDFSHCLPAGTGLHRDNTISLVYGKLTIHEIELDDDESLAILGFVLVRRRPSTPRQNPDVSLCSPQHDRHEFLFTRRAYDSLRGRSHLLTMKKTGVCFSSGVSLQNIWVFIEMAFTDQPPQ